MRSRTDVDVTLMCQTVLKLIFKKINNWMAFGKNFSFRILSCQISLQHNQTIVVSKATFVGFKDRNIL